MERQKTQNSQHNTEEEEQNWKADFPTSRFTLNLQNEGHMSLEKI